MRSNISRRLTHLEEKAGIATNAEKPVLIIVRFVNPNGHGGEQCESGRAMFDNQIWNRKPGETTDDFESRVIANLPEFEHADYVIFHPGRGDETPTTQPSSAANRERR